MANKDEEFEELLKSGEAKIKKGDLEGAIADFDESIRLNPEDEIPRENRSEAKEKLGNDD